MQLPKRDDEELEIEYTVSPYETAIAKTETVEDEVEVLMIGSMNRKPKEETLRDDEKTKKSSSVKKNLIN